LNTWINFIKENNTDNSLLILCGNKIDLQRQVTSKEGINLAEKENMIFFETSAKSGEGVNNMMYTCISKLPFFDKYNIDDKEKLIKELIDTNSSDNVEEKKYNVDFDKNLEFNSSNIIIKDGKNYVETEKKKCGC
jgi:GTPase SAR1 family protein